MATMGSARLLGRQDEIGSLEVGKAADLFLLDVDLLELAGPSWTPPVCWEPLAMPARRSW